MVLGQLDSHQQKMKLEPYLTPYKKNSKWISNINIRAKAMKLLEENERRNHDLGFGNRYLEKSPKS